MSTTHFPLPASGAPAKSAASGAGMALALVTVAAALVINLLVWRTDLGLVVILSAIVVSSAGAVFILQGVTRHHPHARFGMANTVTVARGAIAAILTGIAAELALGATLSTLAVYALLAATGLSLALDGIDGWLARRQGLCSDFGARFDMEVDALTILALAVLAVLLGKAGIWTLAIGLMRYAFLGAGVLWPRLAAPLPPSFRRKAVCVVQYAALIIMLVPAVPVPASSLTGAAALAALAFSFATDVRWLLTRTPDTARP